MTLIQPSTEVQPLAGESPLDAAKIRKLYDDGTRAIRAEQLNYEQNSAFVQGNQWVYVNWQRRQVAELPRTNDRARVTIPRMRPMSRNIIAKVVQRPLKFEVPPNAADDAHVRGARIAEQVLLDVTRQHDWELLREQLAWVVWKGGTGVLCLDWDAAKGKDLGIDPDTGKPVNTGDIKSTCLSITECATEPGTRDIRRANWWVKAQALPPEEVKRMYGLKTDPAKDASAVLSPLQAKVISTNNRGGQTAPLNLTLVLTYYERPNSKNKKGTVAVVVGKEIVDGPYPWPFPFTDRLNLACARETVVETRWTGDTILSDAVPVQTALNASWSSIVEHVKLAGNARLMGEESSSDLFENYTDEAGEIQLYREKPPAYLSPPQMPQWWIEMPDKLGAQLDDILGVHDISRGEAPPNIQSGQGLAVLLEQDETPTGHLVRIVADAFTDFASMVLKIYEKNVTEQRTATTGRPGYANQIAVWDGESFCGQTEARVPYDAVAPLNEAAKFARAMSMIQVGMITTPSQLAAYVDTGNGKSFIEDINWHIAKARRENHAMSIGETMIPAAFDNHSIHIEEHNRFRSTADYERLDDRDRNIVDLHVQAHSTLAAEEMGDQALKAQFAPQLGMAAQAGQPPGSEMPGPPGQSQANNAPGELGTAGSGGSPVESQPQPVMQ